MILNYNLQAFIITQQIFFILYNFEIEFPNTTNLTFPTPPDTCIDDSEEGVTINAREHFFIVSWFS